MEWNNEMLGRLSEIFGKKSKEIMCQATLGLIKPDVDAEHAAYDKAWTAHLFVLGLKMEPLFGFDDPRHLAQDGKVRIVNAWGNRCIEVPEDLALKILALGFLP